MISLILLAGIGVLLLLALLHSTAFGNARLDKIEMLPNEKILFEEDGVRFFVYIRRPGSLYPNCFIRVTNKRIIIAQHALLNKSLPMRALLNYDVSLSHDTDVSGTVQRGYPTFSFDPKQCIYTNKGDRTWIRFITGTPDSALGAMPQYVEITTENQHTYQSHGFGK